MVQDNLQKSHQRPDRKAKAASARPLVQSEPSFCALSRR